MDAGQVWVCALENLKYGLSVNQKIDLIEVDFVQLGGENIFSPGLSFFFFFYCFAVVFLSFCSPEPLCRPIE